MARDNPADRAARRDSIMDARMTRSDSLSSIREFGRVVPISQWKKERKRVGKSKDWNPFHTIKRMLGGEGG